MEAFIKALRADPAVKKLTCVGWCWGARYAILFAKEGYLEQVVLLSAPNQLLTSAGSAVVACHPSFLSIPSDLEGIDRPVSVAVGDKDTIMSIDEVLKLKAELSKRSAQHEVRLSDFSQAHPNL